MTMDDAMAVAGKLLTQAQALSALVARLKIAEMGVEGDPAVNAALDRVADCVGARAHFDALADGERAIVLNFAQSYLRQAFDLIESPEREATWTHSDPAILQAQGTASGFVATMIADSGIGAAATRVLDVGTGVAGLAIAFCRRLPGASVVGIDPFETALALARENVAQAGLEGRITLRSVAVQDFHDDGGFDLVWLPSFFIPASVLDQAVARIHDVTRPGAEVVVGVFEKPEDELARAVDALFTVRSGGSVIDTEEAAALLERAGFVDAHEVERTWMAPLRLVSARRG